MVKLPKFPPKATNPPPPPYEDVASSPPANTENEGRTNATSSTRDNTDGGTFNFNQTNNQTNTFIYNSANRYANRENTEKEGSSCCGIVFTFIVVGTILSVVLTKVYHVGAFSRDDSSKKTPNYYHSGVRANTALAAVAGEADLDDFFSVYYQLDTGDIQLSTVFPLNDTWQIFDVANNATAGTPLAAVTEEREYLDPGYDPARSHVYYVDDTGTLQELSQAHNWKNFEPGPLADLSLKAIIDPMTPLTAGFESYDHYFHNSRCPGHLVAKWVMYWPQGEDYLQEVFWDDQVYEWQLGEKFEGLDAHSGIATMVTELDDVSVRRLFGIGTDGRLNQWYCEACCANTTGLWRKGNSSTTRFSTAQPPNTVLTGTAMQDDPVLYFVPPDQKRVYLTSGPKHLNKSAIALFGGEDRLTASDLAVAYHGYSAIVVYQTENQSQLTAEPTNNVDYGGWPQIGKIPVGTVGN